MAKVNIDEILGEIGSKYDVLDHVDGMQNDPSTMTTTQFKQDYKVFIRKKKYYAITALENDNSYDRIYDISNYISISTSISCTEKGTGTAGIQLAGGHKIMVADRADQDSAGWQDFNEMLENWSYDVEKNADNNDGFYTDSDGQMYDNLDDFKKMKYGWRLAEKCDFEPMDELYIFGKSKRERSNSGDFKRYQLFFGYISDVTKTFSASGGQITPSISIRAEDHLKLLQISYIANTPAMDYRYAVAGFHYDKDFAGNIIIDDNPLATDGPEIPANHLFTNIFAGLYPYEIINKCASDAGIPEKYLKKRIEQVKRVPFLPQPRKAGMWQSSDDLYTSDLKDRLFFCQQAAEKLFLEFFADEEGNIVLKIPNYSLGSNRLPANNAYIDNYMDDSEKENLNNSGMKLQEVEREEITYETITEESSSTITHTVVYGDTLWDLAAHYLGNSLKWPEIYELNKSKIKDPHWIYPGQVFYIKKGTSTTKQVEKVNIIKEKKWVNGTTASSITDKYVPVIEDDEVISFVMTDSDKQVVNCFEIRQEVPLVESSIKGSGAGFQLKRVLQDWQSIVRFGMRPLNSCDTPLLDREVGPIVFGTMMLQRSMSQRIRGTLSMIEESSIRVGNPIRLFTYDEHPYKQVDGNEEYGRQQSVFYVERIERSIKPDGVSTMQLSLSAGRMLGMDSINDKLSLLYDRFYDEYDLNDIVDNYDPPKDDSDSGGGGGNPSGITASQDQILTFAKNLLGTPYKWGGTSPSPGFDCSGFVQYVFAHFDISLPRVTFDQRKKGTSVSSISGLEPCDLIFFNGYNHVGIYIGNNQVIHARGSETEEGLPNYKVQINDLESWYKTYFDEGRRII